MKLQLCGESFFVDFAIFSHFRRFFPNWTAFLSHYGHIYKHFINQLTVAFGCFFFTLGVIRNRKPASAEIPARKRHDLKKPKTARVRSNLEGASDMNLNLAEKARNRRLEALNAFASNRACSAERSDFPDTLKGSALVFRSSRQHSDLFH